MPRLRVLFATTLLALLVAACGRDPDPAPPAGEAPVEASAPPPGQPAPPTRGEHFEVSWLGVLPCADCDGIQTRLVLSGEDGRRQYRLEETYLGENGDDRFEQTGEWTEERSEIGGEPALLYRLDPEGPSRWFWLQPDGDLEMLEAAGRPAADGIDYRLHRL